MFKLAELFVDIRARDDEMRRQVNGLKGQLSSIGVAIGTAAGNLASQAISGATSALMGFISRGVSGAANLGESLSKVDAIFGESSGKIRGMADDMAKSFGLPRQALLDAAAGIGLVGKAAGQSQGQAADLGVQMAKLAADASSFYNVPLEDALNKIRSGLVGESEPLRAFGVLLNEEAVAAEAVALGLAKTTKEVDQQAKVMARASLIEKGLVDATGDLERTADSTANQWRKVTGTLENAAVAMGSAMMPAITSVVGALGDMVTQVAGMIEANKEAIKGWADSIGAAIRAVPDAWDTFVAGLAVAFLKVEEWSTNAVAVFATIPENLRRIGEWIANNWTKLIADGLAAAGTAFTNFGENLKNLGAAIVEFLKDPTKGFKFDWKPLLDGFKATTEALPELLRPELVSMEGAIAAVGEDLARKQSERAKAAADSANKAGGPARAAAQAAAGKAESFKSEVSSVSDFVSKLRGSIYEGQSDSPQVKEQKETNKKLDGIKSALEAIPGMGTLARLG